MADIAGGVGRCQKFYVDHFDKLLLHDVSDSFIKTAKANLLKIKP